MTPAVSLRVASSTIATKYIGETEKNLDCVCGKSAARVRPLWQVLALPIYFAAVVGFDLGSNFARGAQLDIHVDFGLVSDFLGVGDSAI